ncbi:MAG: YqgE/AlgH family protein [Bacteroidales bacterium]|nr:YqgE/AlgH family protein [Bacteroidales bacterium]
MKPGAGKILISEPFLQDFYFRRSVVLLAEHNEDGSFGLIINKPIDVDFNEVVKDFPHFDGQLYLGGPVKTDSLFYIHTQGELIPDSLKIMEGLYWGGDIEQIKEMVRMGQLQPGDIRFFVGYSGWMSKQLDRELNENSWVVSRANRDRILMHDPVSLWNEIVKSLGRDYAVWANYPTDPTLN